MTAPFLPAGRHYAVWGINCADSVANGIRPAAYSLGVLSALRGLGAIPLAPPEGQLNPETTKLPVALHSRQVVTVSAAFQVLGGAEVNGQRLNLQVATAFKNAGAGGGLSVERIANAFNADDSLAEFFSVNPAIARCSADFRPIPGNQWPTVGVTNTVLGSTAGQSAARAITESDNPARVGQRIPGVNGSLFDDAANFLKGLAPGVAIIGTVVVVGGVAIGGAYVVRSFK